MLILLPVILLFLTALGILIQQWIRPSFGYAWLGASGMSLVVWGLVLGLRWLAVEPLMLTVWEPVVGVRWLLGFQIDTNNWLYAFALSGLVAAVILTASARMEIGTTPWSWAGSLAVTGAGILALLANTPLTLILAWTVIDLIELMVFLPRANRPEQSIQIVTAFAARVAGTFILVWAMVSSAARGVDLTLGNIPPEMSILALMAAGLRLGVIPLHLPFTHELRMRRGLGVIIRLVTPVAAFPLISRVPPTVVPPNLAPYFLLFIALTAVYGSAKWLAAKDEIDGRPYWLIALAAIAVGCAVRGRPTAALVWGSTMILSGGLLFLFSARIKRILFIPLLGLIGLTGLPFTPAASGWAGLVVLPFNALDIVLMAAHILLVLGYLRHALHGGDDLANMEPWVHVVYPFGLLLLVSTQWLIGVLGWQGSFTPGTWWAAVASLSIALTIHGFQRRGSMWIGSLSNQFGTLKRLARPGVRLLAAILNLDWLYRFLAAFFHGVQSSVRFLTTILEGDGGVLWAILLLLLLITFFKAGSVP